jgi:hypothetical protein
MRAIEFTTKLKNHSIPVPENIEKQMKSSKNKDVRVLILIEEPEASEEQEFQNIAREQFLKGYSDSDSIYDKQ